MYSTTDLIIGVISFLLTFMILSYLIGDNPAFRVAVYLFVGVSAGYAAAVAFWQVLWPRLFYPLLTGSAGERLLALVPLVLGALLLMKLSPRTARLGGVSVAFLVGIGAAVAVGGALVGTIFPQTLASFTNLPNYRQVLTDPNESYAFLEGIIIIVATISTLVYFHFGAKATPDGPKRSKLVEVTGWIGQVFIAITFGVLFAGVFIAALTALIERWNSIINIITMFSSAHF